MTEPGPLASEPKTIRAPEKRKRRVWVPILVTFAGLIALLALFGWIWWSTDLPDPFPDFSLALDTRVDGEIRAGAHRVDITPVVLETWTDTDQNAKYDPSQGDDFDDADGDGVFDAVWIAGFQNGRPATDAHDPLWARALVIEVTPDAADATTRRPLRIGLVALDLIGLFHTSVLRIREAIATKGDGGRPLVDYLLVASTHTHSGPDTLGLWGPNDFASGVDPEYNARVEASVIESLTEAVARLRPARARFRHARFGAGKLVQDWRRKPIVIDDLLGVLELRDRETNDTIATWVRWASHPETLGSKVTRISSDYPHWLRERIEAAAGGVCVFMNGAIGGMITSLSMDLPHPETGETIPADAGEPELPWLRAQTVGEHVAAEVLRLLETDGGPDLDSLRLHVRAKTIFIGLENPVFRIAAKLGRLDRGSFDGRLRTEVSVIDLGPFRLVGVPGEIYPEIVYGGIETPPGADFAVEPVEVPPIAEALAAPGIEQVLVIGLANDEVGYLIPKSEWDAPILPWDSDGAPPYLYNAEKPPYGEINSCGPNAAKTVHEAILSLPK